MEEKTFAIEGAYKEKGGLKKFSKEIKAVNENYATEKTLAIFGSKHRLKRGAISITKIEEKKE